jgi:hypothetical protein
MGVSLGLVFRIVEFLFGKKRDAILIKIHLGDLETMPITVGSLHNF